VCNPYDAAVPESLKQRLLAIEYLEEEVLVVRVSLACPPERLDHAVGPFGPAIADAAAGRGDDPFPVLFDEVGEPWRSAYLSGRGTCRRIRSMAARTSCSCVHE